SWFHRGIHWKVGMENKFRFWEDAWVEGECLANKFPRLYLLSEQKKKVISEMGFLRDEGWCWDLVWRRHLFEWEGELCFQLTSFLENV
ncbi:hypothetical protein glysoja_044711, partial [Glycine soja]